jgi:hypothetical protein
VHPVVDRRVVVTTHRRVASTDIGAIVLPATPG